MVTPTVIPRENHPISRSLIDPDALKVLQRLRHNDHVAYLVGGSVRDLLPRRTRTRSRSCSATAGSSAGAFAWRT
jgi:hypothetical protein